MNDGGIAYSYWRDETTMGDQETLQQWTAYLETHLTAPFVLSQACIPYMKVSSHGRDRQRTALLPAKAKAVRRFAASVRPGKRR
jgi:NAD(P)-dependent dehydrogenase (short-subunit alcohol dehydrogenase family)